jgi:hypothetical protein
MLLYLCEDVWRHRPRSHAPPEPGAGIDCPHVVAAEVGGDLLSFQSVREWNVEWVAMVLAGAGDDYDLRAAPVEGVY